MAVPILPKRAEILGGPIDGTVLTLSEPPANPLRWRRQGRAYDLVLHVRDDFRAFYLWPKEGTP